jgi:hypothetical protein
MSVIEVITPIGIHHNLFTKCDTCKSSITFYKPNYEITGSSLNIINSKHTCSRCTKKK